MAYQWLPPLHRPIVARSQTPRNEQVAQLSCDHHKRQAAHVAQDAREVTEPIHSDDSPSAGIAEDPFRPMGTSINSLILPTIETKHQHAAEQGSKLLLYHPL